MMPGPGHYQHETQQLRGTSMSLSKSNANKSKPNILNTVMNPPSIPSHLSVFGYEENVSGHLVKQRSNQIGFTGIKYDKVGPGDYEIGNAKNIINKNVTGVVTWKKPT